MSKDKLSNQDSLVLGLSYWKSNISWVLQSSLDLKKKAKFTLRLSQTFHATGPSWICKTLSCGFINLAITHFNCIIKWMLSAYFLSLCVFYGAERLQRFRQGDDGAQFRRSLDVLAGAGPANDYVTSRRASDNGTLTWIMHTMLTSGGKHTESKYSIRRRIHRIE